MKETSPFVGNLYPHDDEQQLEHGLWICFIFLNYWCHYSYIINEWLRSATNHWRLPIPIVLNDINPKLWFGKQAGINPHHVHPSSQRRTAGTLQESGSRGPELPKPGIFILCMRVVYFCVIAYKIFWYLGYFFYPDLATLVWIKMIMQKC